MINKMPNICLDIKDERLGETVVNAFRFKAEMEI